MHKLIDDLSALTTIPVINLSKLVDKATWCICDCVEESKLADEKVVNIDLDLGTLSICFDKESIQYRFVPSKKLETAIKDTIVSGKNPLVAQAEATLAQRIIDVYKSYI